jgi:methanethiol S-methyltransferase
MSRVFALMYGVVAYALFFVTFLYALGFVEGLFVPKTIDSGAQGGLATAVIVDLAILTVFAVQHSVMARPAFKRWWTRFVPAVVERTTYVFLASAALALILWQWRPLPAVVWRVEGAPAAILLAVSFAGWGLVFASTFLINHFELFGLEQVILNLQGREAESPKFRTPLFYKLVRHPLYLGFIIAFWAAPTMTVGHLMFAAVTTAYIFVGALLEERDLVALFGETYVEYRRKVAMLIPFAPK